MRATGAAALTGGRAPRTWDEYYERAVATATRFAAIETVLAREGRDEDAADAASAADVCWQQALEAMGALVSGAPVPETKAPKGGPRAEILEDRNAILEEEPTRTVRVVRPSGRPAPDCPQCGQVRCCCPEPEGGW